MYPDLFGIENFSYTLCMVLGIVLAIVFEIIFLKKKGMMFDGLVDFLICACFAVSAGVVFSILFENGYEFIQNPEKFKWTWGMTFYGGLIGGAGGFLLTYFLMRKNVKFDIRDVLTSAPIAIAIAHSIGRVGCFLAGCCYGRVTDSWIGLPCSQNNPGVNVIPTQLIEAIFLFILAMTMLVLLLKAKFKYNLPLYILAYAIFRFVIEFYRDDPRGVKFALTPSQIWCIVLFVGSIPVFFVIKYLFKNKKDEKK